MSSKKSIASAFLTNMMIVTTASVCILGILWLSQEYIRFSDLVEKTKQRQIEAKRNEIKEKVDRTINFISFMRSQTESRTRDVIRSRVYEAHALASHLFQTYQNTKSIPEIEAMVREALRPIRFSQGRGYFFAFDMEGTEALFADRPELEGKDMRGMRDAQGRYVVPDMIRIAASQGEGFYEYYWTRPGAGDKEFKKFAFVKRFEPFNWVIGTGEYVQDIEEEIQQEVLARLASIDFGPENYLFVWQWDGLCLQGPQAGQNYLHMTDSNGAKVIQELVALSKAGGGFASYQFAKPQGSGLFPKISYVRGVDAWEWFVGTGVYLDEIEAAAAAARKEMNAAERRNVLNIVALLLVTLLAAWWVVRRIGRKTHAAVSVFDAFFHRAVHESVEMSLDGLGFSEFENMARAANTMMRERKQAELDLSESERRLRTILETVNLIALMLDTKGCVTFCNDYLLNLTGWRREEILGRNWFGLFIPEEQRGQMSESFHGAVKSNHCMAHQESEIITRTGERIMIAWDNTILHSSDGTVIGTASLGRNITEQQKLEERLRQTQKLEAIGLLAGGIAHDFNNLLGGILGHADMILIDSQAGPATRDAAKTIVRAAERAAELTSQLLGFARRGKFLTQPVEINEIVREVVRLLSRTLDKNISITQHADEAQIYVLGDPGQLQQVVLNLAINARDAMADGGDLAIQTSVEAVADDNGTDSTGLPPGLYAVLTVRDTGCGIPPGLHSRIFEPFFTTKELGRGTGMGLAMVYGIVQNHGGTITVDSEEGKGSVFKVCLPLHGELIERKASEPGGPVEGGSGRVLVVDDEEIVRAMAAKMLKSLGYEVLTAAGGREAVEIYRQSCKDIDLVLIDMVMPLMDGRETYLALKRIKPALHAILTSGYSIDTRAQAILDEGVEAFLQKPYTTAEMAKVVASVLRGRAQPLRPLSPSE